MARNISVPFSTYSAGTYGPFVIDGRRLEDVGARINIQRGSDGTWPLAAADPVCSILIEFMYGGNWSPAAAATFNGGVQLDKFGSVKTHNYLSVYWAQEMVNGVLTPVRPDAGRVTVTLYVDTPLAASLQWLSA